MVLLSSESLESVDLVEMELSSCDDVDEYCVSCLATLFWVKSGSSGSLRAAYRLSIGARFCSGVMSELVSLGGPGLDVFLGVCQLIQLF
jgi:hypothetical protein